MKENISEFRLFLRNNRFGFLYIKKWGHELIPSIYFWPISSREAEIWLMKNPKNALALYDYTEKHFEFHDFKGLKYRIICFSFENGIFYASIATVGQNEIQEKKFVLSEIQKMIGDPKPLSLFERFIEFFIQR